MYMVYMGAVLLPLAPEKITMKIKGQNKTMNLINDGEVNVLHSAGLTEISFECTLPASKNSLALYSGSFKSPAYFLEKFESYKTEKQAFTFKIARRFPNGKMLFDTSIDVALENYSITDDVQNGFDISVSVDLKQYKPYGTKLVKVISSGTETKTAAVQKSRETINSPTPKTEQTYTVKSGDTLWKIAKSFYGDGSKYTKIYQANKDKITNPNLIYVGQVFTIPEA